MLAGVAEGQVLEEGLIELAVGLKVGDEAADLGGLGDPVEGGAEVSEDINKVSLPLGI